MSPLGSPRLCRLVRRVFLLLAFCCQAALAGVPCNENPPAPEAILKGLELAHKTRQTLDAQNAQVALIGRVGQDLSRYGLRYSHMAFVWRDHPEGRWLVVHLLNECGTAQSNLYDQGLGNFFSDDLYAWETRIVIPSPAVQAKLAQALADPRTNRLHEARYNMVAYPFATQYQNSNQWVLEMLNEAYRSSPANNRTEAQRWLKNAGYQPSELSIPALTRLGGRMFRANVAFDDHPSELRWQGKIQTVTVESVFHFVGIIDPYAQTIDLAFQ